MKATTVIGFRPKQDEADDFAKRVERLGVEKTELVSLAYRRGLEQATKELADKQERQALETVRRMRSFAAPVFQPSGFDLVAA